MAEDIFASGVIICLVWQSHVLRLCCRYGLTVKSEAHGGRRAGAAEHKQD